MYIVLSRDRTHDFGAVYFLNPDVGVCLRLTRQATDLQISYSTKQKQNLQGHMLQF